MKMGKIITLILVLILVIPSVSSIASSQGGNNTSRESLIHKLLRIRFNLGYLEKLPLLGRYFVFQFRPPIPIQAYPESLSLKYLNQTTFEIGGKDPRFPSGWSPLVELAQGWNWAWMDTEFSFHFEFVPPENASEDIWNVQFDPEYLILLPNTKNLDWPGAETPFKTNVTIMLKPGVDPSVVTQDTVIKINVYKTEVLDKFGLLKGAPQFAKTHKEEYIQKCYKFSEIPWFTGSNITIYNLLFKYTMFLNNAVLPLVDTSLNGEPVQVLIKVNKYHLAEITPPLPLEIQPYEVKSIPVTIQNIGSHIDTYNFRVNCSDKNMIVVPPPAITLKPGEEGQALVGVAAPRTYMAAGSTTSIFVEAYSIDDPKTVFSNTIILTTSGVNVAGEATYNVVFLLAILLIVVALYLYLSKKRREKFCKKPEKPWEIPEEKEYLEKLKDENKEGYNKVLEMMKEEYESSLLWYTSYVKAMMEKERREREKARTAAKEKRLKEKKLAEKQSKTKKIKEQKPIVPREEKIEKTTEEPVEKIETGSLEDRRKQEAILRIKQEQEKQKKKFKV